MRNPAISIIIPTFNRAHLIKDTIRSIQKQSYQDWECLIVDDGSTDGTAAYVEELSKKDSRLSYIQRPDSVKKGAPGCRNYGFNRSKGNYIKFLDSDDVLNAGALEIPMEVLEKHPELDFISSQWEYFNASGDRRLNFVFRDPGDNRIKAYLMQSHYFITSVPLWKRSFLEGKVLFDEQLKRSQEADFNFRRLLEKPKYVVLPDFLVAIREGHDNITQRTRVDASYKVSNLIYFCRVLDHLVKNKEQYDKETLEYQTYRALTTYYEVAHLKESHPYYAQLVSLLWRTSLSTFMKVRFRVGLFLVRYFRKGYSLIYEPSFDHRTEEFIEDKK